MTTICRVYLAGLSAYHVATGVISFFFPGAAMRFYRALYACDPAERRQLTVVMKPWGALALFAGIAGGCAAVDPNRYVGVVAGLWLLLILRIVFRVGCRRELEEVGGIPPHRNLVSVGAIAVGVVVLALWLAQRWARGAQP